MSIASKVCSKLFGSSMGGSTDPRVQKSVEDAVSAMCRIVAARTSERVFPIYYGSVDVDPKLLAIWICVQTDQEKRRLSDEHLVEALRDQLKIAGYPPQGLAGVHIGFESRQTVDRTSNGDWWGHFR